MRSAFLKTIQNIKMSIPIVIAVLMLVNLINPLIQKYYPQIFTGNYFIDPFLGAVAGTVSFGIPIASYITGGELLEEGVSLIAVTAFIISWSTVYFIILPLEISFLGKRFAIWRNALNFVSSIVIAILTIITLKLFV
jgi:hypothetical protein